MKDIVLKFIEAINAADVEKIYPLMAQDHVFVDNIGSEYKGAGFMKKGWESYFALFPDYKIEVTEIYDHGSILVLLGRASGSYKGEKSRHWQIPAAWRAEVENGKVLRWQVFADTKLQFDAMATG